MRKRKDLRLPNKYGGVVYLGEKRRKPYGARITIGFEPKGEKNGVMEYRQKYKYLGFFEKRTQALECLMEYNKSPYDLETRKLTFNDIYETWLKKHAPNISVNTMKIYKQAYKRCEPLYEIPFYSLKTRDLQEVIDNISSPSIAKQTKILLGHLYKLALKNEYCDKDCSSLVELPKQEKIKPKIPFAKEEIELLWKYEGDYFADMLLILLYSGLRIAELLALENDKINLKERYMIGGLKTEAGKDRVIPIHKDIVRLIEKNMSDQKTLYVGARGGEINYSYLRKKMSAFLKSHNLNHTFHDTRHTFISQCSRLNFNELTIKRIVGHSSGDITERYTHKNIADLVSAIDNFVY